MKAKSSPRSNELAFNRALTAAVAEHKRYLSLLGVDSTSRPVIEQRRAEWRLLQEREARMRAQLSRWLPGSDHEGSDGTD
jgi:hypothetical protein